MNLQDLQSKLKTHNIQFYLKEDETGGPAFYFKNPWNQNKEEKIATLLWPIHPVEVTDQIDYLYENLKLTYSP